MLKETLTSLVLGAVCLFGSAKADLEPPEPMPSIPVECNFNTDLQTYINQAQGTEYALSLYPGQTTGIYGNYEITADLTIYGNGCWLKSTTNVNPLENYVLDTSSSAVVTLDNLPIFAEYNASTGQGVSKLINVRENSSLNWANSDAGCIKDSVYFNSVGDLTLNNIFFSNTENVYGNERKVVLEIFRGDINISENTFTGGGTAIYVGIDLGSNLEILNNTIDSMKEKGIDLSRPLHCSGYIANNSFSNMDTFLTNEQNLGNIVCTNNNCYEGQIGGGQMGGDLMLKTLVTGMSGGNFEFDPMYVNPNEYDFRLQPDSELWNKGLYIEGKTPWFPNENTTWIGAYGEIPEPSILELLVISGLSGLGYRTLRKHARD